MVSQFIANCLPAIPVSFGVYCRPSNSVIFAKIQIFGEKVPQQQYFSYVFIVNDNCKAKNYYICYGEVAFMVSDATSPHVKGWYITCKKVVYCPI